MRLLVAAVSTNVAALCASPPITITLSPNGTIEPLNSFGWTAATLSANAANSSFTLTNDAAGQFSIGGSMLRLEKPLGAVGTVYTIQIQATAPGYAPTTTTFSITVTNTMGTGLVEVIDATSLSLMWQDSAGTTPVTADGQTVNRLQGSVAGWVATCAATGPTYKANILNGLGVLRFSGGSTQFLSFITSTAINFFGTSWKNAPWTVIAVVNPTDLGAQRDIMGVGDNSSASYLLLGQNATTGYPRIVLGSGGANYSDSMANGLVSGQASVVMFSSDGCPDDLHITPMLNAAYSYGGGSSLNSPMMQSGSSPISGTMSPIAHNIGGRGVSSKVPWKGDIAALYYYNRNIGSVEGEYICNEIAQKYGIASASPTNTYLDTSGWPLWWQDDFDGSVVNWTPAQGVSGSSTLGSDGNPTGWLPGYIAGTSAKTFYGSPGAVSNELAWMVDPRNPLFAANGAGGIYSVSDSVLTMTAQATPAVHALNANNSFTITNTAGGTNLITTNANFSSLGVVVGDPIVPGGSLGGLISGTQYWIASIPNSGANSTFIASTTPPWVGNTTRTLTTASGSVSCTSKPCGAAAYLAGAMVSAGWKQRQFGIIQMRAKLSVPQNGIYNADWMMPANNAWYGEIDTLENFSNQGNAVQYSTLHSIAYAQTSSTNCQSQINHVNEPGDGQFHEWSVEWDETGTSFYFDGRSIGSTPAWGGIRAVTITSPGSGLTNGTYTLFAAAPQSPSATGSAPKLTLTVAGGAVVGYTIVSSGSQLSSQPTWYTNSGLTTPLSTTLPGVALTCDISDDPAIPMGYYEPFYLLYQLGINTLSGTYTGVAGFPSFQIDRIRWFKKQYPVPTPVSASTEVAAIVSYWSGQGVTMSSGDQVALTTFISTLKSYQLRKDTTPPTDIASYWDTTKLSLWEAIDALYVPGLTYNVANQTTAKSLSKMNLKAPGTNDLSENGSGVTYAPSTGLSLPGTAGVYLNSGQSAVQYTNQDGHFSLFLPAAPSNGTVAALCGFNSFRNWSASGTAFGALMGATLAPASFSSMSRVLTGHMAVNRGWRHACHQYQNGDSQWSGGYSSNNVDYAVVTVSGRCTSPATATATVSAGAITAITVTNGGTGYAAAPVVAISAFNGSGAAATASISGGVVTGITVTSGGSGYNNGPSGTFKIGSADGSTAGAAFSFLSASVGRRLAQAECEIYNSALRALFSSLGIPLTV